ncbi:hypothetical protein [Bdellovibrio bacteriovorus]|uniref:hypothetical protein n=1 Tax=Bdellovibrio bacteriovorus TaxID=959 RepID=UPI0035A5F63A
MNFTQTCPICYETSGCLCLLRVVRFIELLERADQRVSSTKLTSKEAKIHGQACIDKLEADLLEPISKDQIYHRCKELDIEVTIQFLRRRPHLRIGPETGTFLKLSFDQKYVVQIITRPAAFDSANEYILAISNILGAETLTKMKVTRVDLTVDHDIPFSKFICGIDIKNKQSEIQYTNKGHALTGISIGKGADNVTIYDKQRQAKTTTPRSRVERRLRGSKLPSRDFIDLWNKIPSLEPFSDIELFDVNFKEELTLSREQLSRQANLRLYLPSIGFIRTRKQFNEHGNFERDYGPLFTKTRWEDQMNDVFRTAIKKYFKTKEEDQHESNHQSSRVPTNKRGLKIVRSPS